MARAFDELMDDEIAAKLPVHRRHLPSPISAYLHDLQPVQDAERQVA
jgi:hypothetical protein